MSSIPLSMTFVVGVSENDSDVNDSKLTGYHTFYQVLSFTAKMAVYPPITDFIYIWYNHSGNNLVTWAHTLNAVPPTQLSFINIAW